MTNSPKDPKDSKNLCFISSNTVSIEKHRLLNEPRSNGYEIHNTEKGRGINPRRIQSFPILAGRKESHKILKSEEDDRNNFKLVKIISLFVSDPLINLRNADTEESVEE